MTFQLRHVRGAIVRLSLSAVMALVLMHCDASKDEFKTLQSTYSSFSAVAIEQDSRSVDQILERLEKAREPLNRFQSRFSGSGNIKDVNEWESQIAGKISEWRAFQSKELARVNAIGENLATVRDCKTALDQLKMVQNVNCKNQTQQKIYNQSVQDKGSRINDQIKNVYLNVITQKKSEIVGNLEQNAKHLAGDQHTLSDVNLGEELSSTQDSGPNTLTISKVYYIQIKQRHGFIFTTGSNGSMKIRSSALISFMNIGEDPRITYETQILSDDCSR